jgi:hypothetical protein
VAPDVQFVSAVGALVMVAVPVLSALVLTLVLGQAIIRAEPCPGGWKGGLTLNALRRARIVIGRHSVLHPWGSHHRSEQAASDKELSSVRISEKFIVSD